MSALSTLRSLTHRADFYGNMYGKRKLEVLIHEDNEAVRIVKDKGKVKAMPAEHDRVVFICHDDDAEDALSDLEGLATEINANLAELGESLPDASSPARRLILWVVKKPGREMQEANFSTTCGSSVFRAIAQALTVLLNSRGIQ